MASSNKKLRREEKSTIKMATVAKFSIPLISLFAITTSSAINVTDFQKYVHTLEERINSLEQPVWAVSWDDSRWSTCTTTGPCICDRNQRQFNCWNLLDEPGLPSQQIVPWDVEFMDFGKNKIKAFANSAFKHFRRLNELNMFDNELEHIPKFSLDFLTRLWRLRLYNNKLSNLDPDLLRRLVSLRTLDFSFNFIEAIPDLVFRNNRDLRFVQLSHNKICEIGPDTFRGLITVAIVDLSHNNIGLLKSGSFGDLPELKQLDLSNNKIKNVHGLSASNLTTIKSLDLRFNSIKTLNEGTFDLMPNLRHLYLSSNKLSQFLTGSVPNWLASLDLSKNLIEKVTVGSNGKSTLNLLDLSSNNLESLPVKFFADFDHLEKLDLSNNMLRTMEFLPDLPKSILELNLRMNLIERIISENGTLVFDGLEPFENLYQLRTIYLRGNLWHCDCALKTFFDFFVQRQLVDQIESLECSSPFEVEFQPLFSTLQELEDC